MPAGVIEVVWVPAGASEGLCQARRCSTPSLLVTLPEVAKVIGEGSGRWQTQRGAIVSVLVLWGSSYEAWWVGRKIALKPKCWLSFVFKDSHAKRKLHSLFLIAVPVLLSLKEADLKCCKPTLVLFMLCSWNQLQRAGFVGEKLSQYWIPQGICCAGKSRARSFSWGSPCRLWYDHEVRAYLPYLPNLSFFPSWSLWCLVPWPFLG